MHKLWLVNSLWIKKDSQIIHANPGVFYGIIPLAGNAAQRSNYDEHTFLFDTQSHVRPSAG